MLNFRNTNIAFAVLLVLLAVVDYHYSISFFSYILLAFIYSLILFFGSYNVGSNFFFPVVCSANTNKKEIALSFDDGPAEQYTPAILEVLGKYQIPAAFFCIGNRIKGNEGILHDIHQQGHIIGNHSYSHHFWFDMFTSKKMLADLQQTDAILRKELAVKPAFFRPPYGVTTPPMQKALLQGQYLPIGWNIRSMDTVVNDENKLFAKVSKALKPGAILLFHDTSKTTVSALPRIIEDALDKGYEFVRLDKLINKKAYK